MTQSTTSGPSPCSGSPFLVAQHGRDGRDGVTGRDGRDGLPGRTGEKGDPGVQGPQGLTGPQGKKNYIVEKYFRTFFGIYIILLTLNNQVLLVPVWVVQCTSGGGGQCVQTSLEHNSCMLEELPEATGTTREGGPTASTYLMTQATYSTDLGRKLIVITCMVQSTTPQMDHSQHFKTTMCHVLCAMFLPGEQ